MSASAYLAPSTSLCASAESTPVSGLTIPIRTGVSPLALIMKGDENCTAAIAALDFRMVRRSIDQGRCEIAMLSSQDGIFVGYLVARRSAPPLGGEPSRSRLLLPMVTPVTFGLFQARPPRKSMLRGAIGGVVVEDDKRIDGDAGPGIDQERIDVDRCDAISSVRHQ